MAACKAVRGREVEDGDNTAEKRDDLGDAVALIGDAAGWILGRDHGQCCDDWLLGEGR